MEPLGKWADARRKRSATPKTAAAGLYNQAASQAQQQAAQLGDVIKDQPLAAVLIALGIGYLLGRLTA